MAEARMLQTCGKPTPVGSHAAGEAAAGSGQWIAINMRGHVSIHNTKPDGWKKETITGVAFTVLIAAVLVIMLAM